MTAQGSRRLARLLLAALLAGLLSREALEAGTPVSPAVESYIQKLARACRVPGLSVAVVCDDKVVYAKGFGVRKLGSPEPVNEETVFPIGSTTKAFTAAAIGILVAEGKLGWDDPIIRHYPAFQLADPVATREATIRDFLCHRSGLPGDGTPTVVWGYSRSEIVRRLRFQKPGSHFRSVWTYSNLGLTVPDVVFKPASGKTWDEVVLERIFEPLGMRSSSTGLAGLRKMTNVATPHGVLQGQVGPVDYLDVDPHAPAGSICSNAVDMARWIRVQLGKGTFEGKRLWPPSITDEMFRPHMLQPPPPPQSPMADTGHFRSYGLCWGVSDYYGLRLIKHGGATNGICSVVALLPDRSFGVVVLTNLAPPNMAPDVIAHRILDACLGLRERDWLAELTVFARNAPRPPDPRRVKGTKPSVPLAECVGIYEDELHGEISVGVEADRLVVRIGPKLVGKLEHWHHDTFTAKWNDPGLGSMISPRPFFTFVLGEDGRVEGLWSRLGPEPTAFRRRRT
ncbi:MAG: serine hydrolase [Candidatus Riflebacteria bacterium]|nr:serine hydrolase [Candidatus Riflebacteria bacterium]